MRKRVFIGLLLFGAIAVLIFVSRAGQSGTGTVFGPDFFIRAEGKPFIESREFSSAGYQAPFLLHLRNGNEEGSSRVSSARIWLNDMLLLGPNNFSQEVPGYDIPVELKEQNVLKVELASAPGSKLKIWIEGIPITVIPEFVLDEENGVSAFIANEAGGRIETWGANGVNYVLEIPPSSLLELEGKTITLTPILSAAGLPSNSLFVAGARLMPDGLQLFRSVKLTIKLPSLTSAEDVWGVCYNGSLGEHYTHPFLTVDQATATISFELRHFSDWVAVNNSNCPSANPAYQQDIYKSALACLTRSSVPDQDQIDTLLTGWFRELVMPELYQATDLKRLKNAFNLYLEWWVTLQLLGREEAYQNQISQAKAQISLVIKNEFLRMNTECTQSTDWCVKEKLFKEYVLWMAEAQQLLDQASLEDLPQVTDFCSYYDHAIGNIDIGATSDHILVNNTLAFISVVTGKQTPPQQIANAPVSWSSSDNSIAIVEEAYFDQDGIPNARIRGIAPGQVTITVKANYSCNLSASKTITVCEVGSVEVIPSTKAIIVGQTVHLDVVVKDTEGNVINGLPIAWTIPAGGKISFNVYSQNVTGVAVGGPATLVATCGEKNGTANIAVVGIEGEWEVNFAINLAGNPVAEPSSWRLVKDWKTDPGDPDGSIIFWYNYKSEWDFSGYYYYIDGYNENRIRFHMQCIGMIEDIPIWGIFGWGEMVDADTMEGTVSFNLAGTSFPLVATRKY